MTIKELLFGAHKLTIDGLFASIRVYIINSGLKFRHPRCHYILWQYCILYVVGFDKYKYNRKERAAYNNNYINNNSHVFTRKCTL